MSETPGNLKTESTPETRSGHDATSSGLWAGCALLITITLLAYLPALPAGFTWDDDAWLTGNPTLGSVRGLWQIWSEPRASMQYYPLLFTSYWIEQRIWGLNPAGYHFVNIVLHGCSAVLLWRILRRLDVPGAWLAATLFAVHPVHVESVAWITERKNVLSGVFALGSVLAFLRDCGIGDKSPASPRPPRLFGWPIVLYAAAMLSKTAACSVPAVLLLILWWRRGRMAWREVRSLIPMFVVGVAMGLTTAWLEKSHVGAEGSEWAFSPLDRCLIAGRAVWFYAGKLAWPARLTFVYPRWHIDATAAWQYLYPAGVLVAITLLWALRRRIGRGPLVGFLIFAGTLLPALGFFNVYFMRYSFVADHFQYLASIGLLSLAAALLMQVPVIGNRRGPAAASIVAQSLLITTLGVLTWRQCSIYSDPERLWRDTIDKNPNTWLAWTNLGRVLLDQGRNEESLACYARALEVSPEVPDVHSFMGFALMRLNRFSQAIPHTRRALELKPDYVPAMNDLGVMLAITGNREEALRYLQRATDLAPKNANIRYNLAYALAQQNEFDKAETEYTRVLEINPRTAKAHVGLAELLQRRGRADEAIEHYRQAVSLMPKACDIRCKLAASLAQRGQTAQASSELEVVLRIDPFNADAAGQLRELRARRP
jgi:protein O-mannosyl-transferase